MHRRRAIALLLIALLGLALYHPDRPDDGQGAVRHGRHVGRPDAEGLPSGRSVAPATNR